MANLFGQKSIEVGWWLSVPENQAPPFKTETFPEIIPRLTDIQELRDLLLKERFPVRLKEEREVLELSQQVLAQRAGMDQGDLSKLESGKHTPTLTTIDRLAAAMQIPSVFLVIGRESSHSLLQTNLERSAFPVRLKEQRELRGWSQKELASRAGMHRQNITDLEQGKHEPALSTLFRISEVFEISPIVLLMKSPS